MNIGDFRGGTKQQHFPMTKLSYISSLFSYNFDNYSAVTSPMLEVHSASSDIKVLVITKNVDTLN